MGKKVKICFSTNERIFERLNGLSEMTGISVSELINLKLNGYGIYKIDEPEKNWLDLTS